MWAQWLSGRVLDSRPRGHGFKPHSRHRVVVLEQDTIYPSLVLVQPRKTRPCLTERLLMGRKDSNQINNHYFITQSREVAAGSGHEIGLSFDRLHTGLDKPNFEHKIVNIFSLISFNMCFGCSKEPSHWDSSFEYQQHIFGWVIKKFILGFTLLTKGRCMSCIWAKIWQKGPSGNKSQKWDIYRERKT